LSGKTPHGTPTRARRHSIILCGGSNSVFNSQRRSALWTSQQEMTCGRASCIYNKTAGKNVMPYSTPPSKGEKTTSITCAIVNSNFNQAHAGSYVVPGIYFSFVEFGKEADMRRCPVCWPLWVAKLPSHRRLLSTARKPKGYWRDVSNQRTYLDNLGKQLRVSQVIFS